MKDKGDELLVINKRVFYLILLGVALSGLLVGYFIGYVFTPTKEVYVQKTVESEKTVLPASVETALAKKPEAQGLNLPKEPSNSTNQTLEETKKEESKREPKETLLNQTQKLEERKPEQKETDLSRKEQVALEPKLDSAKVADRQRKRDSVKQYYYTVQIGAFSERSNSERMKEELNKAGYKVFIVKEDTYKVRLGRFFSVSQAKSLSDELKRRGFENFIVRVKGHR